MCRIKLDVLKLAIMIKILIRYDVNGVYPVDMGDELLNNSNAQQIIDNHIHKYKKYKIKSNERIGNYTTDTN